LLTDLSVHSPSIMGAQTTQKIKWETVIGLEVHAQLSTKTKMFCGCKNEYGAPPNTNVCPVCLGLPGSLPVTNEKAIVYALKLGLALGCEIRMFSRFERKNYFYPDLPKGYQISQFEEPLCDGGVVTIRENGKLKEIKLTRIHLEEDAGKSIHSENGTGTKVDFNRCGVPLAEIVSEPVIHSPAEARRYLMRLKQVLQYLDICDCNMEEGNLRCDANISLRLAGEDEFGVRTEMKNMNSFRGVERALAYEIKRQAEILDNGGKIEQATLLWNEEKQIAEIMRSKEFAHDYRYFPDPDLVPIVIDDDQLKNLKKSLGKLPHEKENTLIESYGLREEDAVIIASDSNLADYFEDIVKQGAKPEETAKWVLGQVLRKLKKDNITILEFTIEANRLTELLKVIDEGVINITTARNVFNEMLASQKSTAEIIEEKGWGLISDSDKLQTVVEDIITNNPFEVKRYREGKKELIGFFMGMVMKKTRGQSDPQAVQSILIENLEKAD